MLPRLDGPTLVRLIDLPWIDPRDMPLSPQEHSCEQQPTQEAADRKWPKQRISSTIREGTDRDQEESQADSPDHVLVDDDLAQLAPSVVTNRPQSWFGCARTTHGSAAKLHRLRRLRPLHPFVRRRVHARY
jgi:hypothetical protein